MLKDYSTPRLFIIQTILAALALLFFHWAIAHTARNVHDQYFIDNINFAAGLFISYGLFFAIAYYIFRQRLNKKLGLLHFTLGLPLFLLTFAERLGLYDHDPIPRRYYTNSTSTFFDIFPVYGSLLYQLLIILWLLGLAVFVINLVNKKR